MAELTRKELDTIAKNRGIIDPQKMSIQELTDTLNRYDSRRKVMNICRKLSKIGPKKLLKYRIFQKLN